MGGSVRQLITQHTTAPIIPPGPDNHYFINGKWNFFINGKWKNILSMASEKYFINGNGKWKIILSNNGKWKLQWKRKFHLHNHAFCFSLIFFFSFLAAQDSSIGDLVTESLTHWLTQSTFTFDIQRATLETSDLWDSPSDWWVDINWPKRPT